MIGLTSRIREYEKDFYKWKSPELISKKIDIEVDIILDYLNENLNSITVSNSKKRYFIDHKITRKTELYYISSYQILKEIQAKNLIEKVDRNIIVEI